MSLQFQVSFERFGLAADDLMTCSNDHIKESLRRAFNYIEPVRENNVPEELREQFNSIHKRIKSGIPQNREGSLKATVNQLNKEDRNQLIEDILNFNQSLIWWRRENSK